MDIQNDSIILVDKPKGITSFDVIRILRKKTGFRKMGHAGTLDPLATGLMIIAIGSATKELNNYLKLPKVYEAEILLGKQTDTGDVEGDVILEKELPDLIEEKIKEVLKNLEGEIELPVPAYSAIKKEGKPLYAYARAGETVEVPIKKMGVIEASFINYQKPVIIAKFHVASGTYIRSLAEEIGKRLGTVATLQNLRRTSIGEFKV